ncbi:MAG: hypothetical protein ACLUH5_02440 [Eubacterium sp.]
MQKLQEEEFAKIKPTTKPEECTHEIVKLYYKGSHTDYGCIKCKAQSFNKEDLERNKD